MKNLKNDIIKYEKISFFKKLGQKKFKRAVGIKIKTFEKLMESLYKNISKKDKKKGGRPPKLSVEDKLLITLAYYRDYSTQLKIGIEYCVSESCISKTIKYIENLLCKSITFMIKGKKELINKINDKIAIDVTEIRIERPQKKQKKYYSGKKKYHSIKAQIVATKNEIISIYIDTGKTHDFEMFKKSKLPINIGNTILTDLGYQGIKKLHTNTKIPHKKTKNKKLTNKQKRYNKSISSDRVFIEHLNAKIKTFKMFSTRYRNHKKDILKRLNFIAAFINSDLKYF